MTVSIAWMTPFEAFTSATITFEVPFSVSFPARIDSLIRSPWTVFTDAFFFAAAIAAVLWTFRISSLGTQVVLWGSLGLIFGILAKPVLDARTRAKERALSFAE